MARAGLLKSRLERVMEGAVGDDSIERRTELVEGAVRGATREAPGRRAEWRDSAEHIVGDVVRSVAPKALDPTAQEIRQATECLGLGVRGLIRPRSDRERVAALEQIARGLEGLKACFRAPEAATLVEENTEPTLAQTGRVRDALDATSSPYEVYVFGDARPSGWMDWLADDDIAFFRDHELVYTEDRPELFGTRRGGPKVLVFLAELLDPRAVAPNVPTNAALAYDAAPSGRQYASERREVADLKRGVLTPENRRNMLDHIIEQATSLGLSFSVDCKLADDTSGVFLALTQLLRDKGAKIELRNQSSDA